jgi:hypothetical protein
MPNCLSSSFFTEVLVEPMAIAPVSLANSKQPYPAELEIAGIKNIIAFFYAANMK